MSASVAPWPTELRLQRSANTLRVSFDDGRVITLGAARLRRATPSAADHGHGPRAGRRPIEVTEDLKLTDLRPIGRYAVQIVFSDGHDTGFYTWPLLYKLGEEPAGPDGPVAQA